MHAIMSYMFDESLAPLVALLSEFWTFNPVGLLHSILYVFISKSFVEEEKGYIWIKARLPGVLTALMNL